jgi:hypothetical protein
MDNVWKRALAAVQRGEGTHTAIAGRYGVPVSGLRYRLYRDRARQEARSSQTRPVNVLPVQVVEPQPQGRPAQPAEHRVEVNVGEITIRFTAGCAVDYVAELIRALRAC